MTVPRGLIWPLALIAIGILLLAANFGYVAPVSIFALFSLWPLVLILVGVEIAVAPRWPLAALAAQFAIVAAGVALVVAQPLGPGGALLGGDGPGEPVVSVPRGDETRLELRLSGAAAAYDIAAGGPDLVRVESDRSDLRLRRTDRGGGRAEVRIEQGRGFRFGPATPARVTVRISPEVATSLRLDAGAGEFTLDLSSLRLSDADINVGAASLRLIPPKPVGEVSISISAGASSIVIEIPRDIEARVATTGALTSTQIEDPRRFNGPETAGYASAKDRVTIKINAGASSVTVR